MAYIGVSAFLLVAACHGLPKYGGCPPGAQWPASLSLGMLTIGALGAPLLMILCQRTDSMRRARWLQAGAYSMIVVVLLAFSGPVVGYFVQTGQWGLLTEEAGLTALPLAALFIGIGMLAVLKGFNERARAHFGTRSDQ